MWVFKKMQLFFRWKMVRRCTCTGCVNLTNGEFDSIDGIKLGVIEKARLSFLIKENTIT